MSQAHQKRVCEFMSAALGVKIEIAREDRLFEALLEGAYWLRLGAPGRALNAIEAGLKAVTRKPNQRTDEKE